jgi:hypothetical protein
MNDCSLKENATATGHQKKIKTDESSAWLHSCVTCGADVVIGHVLPFLISTGDDDHHLRQLLEFL